MNARMTAAAVSFALVSLGCAHVRPVAPVLPGAEASPPTPPDSVANATVDVDLTKLQGAIESAVPTVFATNNWSGQRWVPVLSVEGVATTQDGFVVRALATGTLQVSAIPNATVVPPTFWPL